MKMEINLIRTRNYSDKFEELRKVCFPGPLNDNSDFFNYNSEFLAFCNEEELFAVGRITPNPNGAFITQTNSLGDFRNEADTVDLCKCMVNPKYRTRYLFEILILSGLFIAAQSGKKFVNGAVVKDKLKERFTGLHFNVDFQTTILHDPYGNIKTVTPMRCDLMGSFEKIQADLHHYLNLMKDERYYIDQQKFIAKLSLQI